MVPLRSLAANGGARRYPVGFNHLPHRARSTGAVTEVMKTTAQRSAAVVPSGGAGGVLLPDQDACAQLLHSVRSPMAVSDQDLIECWFVRLTVPEIVKKLGLKSTSRPLQPI